MQQAQATVFRCMVKMRLNKKSLSELYKMLRNPDLTPYLRSKIYSELDSR